MLVTLVPAEEVCLKKERGNQNFRDLFGLTP